MEVVEFYVSSEAWLVRKDWLKVGRQLFMTINKDIAMEKRDFLMRKPNETLRGFRKGMLSYPEAMCYSRALLTELYSIRLGEDGQPQRLMIPESTSYWSERSVTQAQAHVASKIKAQYCITDYTDDKSVLNNFALWLQAVHGRTPTQAHAEIMKLAPPTWGGVGNGPCHALSKPIRKKAEGSDDSPTGVQ